MLEVSSVRTHCTLLQTTLQRAVEKLIPSGATDQLLEGELSMVYSSDAQLPHPFQDPGTDLSSGEREMFYELLLSYIDVMAWSNADLRRTDKLQHHIHTGDAHPVRQSVRRIPPHRREEVRKLLDDMLEVGVIEPSASPWASPVVLVRKKDGSTRFCIDYRKLNEVTRKDAYPLPRIDAILDTLSGSQWFTTLDLLSGYWQVEMREADKPKTAFCMTEGLFPFQVTPFSLSNVPATL